MDYTLLLSAKLKHSRVLRKESLETDCQKTHSQVQAFGEHSSPATSQTHTSENRHRNLTKYVKYLLNNSIVETRHGRKCLCFHNVQYWDGRRVHLSRGSYPVWENFSLCHKLKPRKTMKSQGRKTCFYNEDNSYVSFQLGRKVQHEAWLSHSRHTNNILYINPISSTASLA